MVLLNTHLHIHTLDQHSLALRLLGDVADSSSLLADDGSHILCGYQQSQRDVGMWRFAGHPGGGPATRSTAGPVARATAIIGTPLPSLQLRGFVRDIGDTQGVVLKLVSIQLLDGSERERAALSMSVINRDIQMN